MEDLLAYSKYERVICIVFDDPGRLLIHTSSNRAIDLRILFDSDDYTLQDKPAQSLLKEYLDACAKEQDQQSGKEKHAILIVQQHARQLKQKLLQDERIVFDRCQLLFILPFGWDCNEYMERLRALFMETRWIHQNDPKNRLIFSPFIENLCQSFIADNVYNFEREKKYLLLSMDKTTIHLSSFQMQSAKELIAVSKKLAASDFLLVPTVLGDAVTMDISDLDPLIYNKVKEIILRRVSNSIQRKRFYKRGSFRLKKSNKKLTQKQHNNMNGATRSLFSVKILRRIIKGIINTLYFIVTADKNMQLHKTLYLWEVLECILSSIKILRGLTCGVLMNKLLTDMNIKRIIDQLICTVKDIFSKYSTAQNSPDGISDVILYCHHRTNLFYRKLFRMALLDANLVDAQNDFNFRLDNCFGAMQKPLKMVQIANALLPPTIWKDGNSKQLEWTDHNTREEDLLPPNSFYVQAYINDDHIRFILNKVIAVSSLNGTVQKSTFTIQETSVELESIFDSVCDTMWNHLMMPECQRHPELFHQCDTHLAGEYSAADYHFFKCSIHEMTKKLLQKDFVKCNQDIDSNHAIPISKGCNCSFQISYRTLIDIGLQPAISHIATIIASSLASNSFFGLYTASALIIMDDSKDSILQKHRNIFEKTLRRCLQAHHGRTTVFYSRETVMAACASLGSWCAGLQQVFGKGSYSQVSSTDYVTQFSTYRRRDIRNKFTTYKHHLNSLKKGDFIERPNEFVILKKGQAVDPNGSIHTFHYCDFSSANQINLLFFIRNRHENKEYYHHLWGLCAYRILEGHPLTVRVTPQHHSSTIEFEVSYVAVSDDGGIHPIFESFSIQERLALK